MNCELVNHTIGICILPKYHRIISDKYSEYRCWWNFVTVPSGARFDFENKNQPLTFQHIWTTSSALVRIWMKRVHFMNTWHFIETSESWLPMETKTRDKYAFYIFFFKCILYFLFKRGSSINYTLINFTIFDYCVPVTVFSHCGFMSNYHQKAFCPR